mgnify:FL=1
MKKFSCFVADRDNFPGPAHELIRAWQNEHQAVHIIDFSVPKGTDDRTVSLIAKGLMWEDGWTEDGTKHHVVEDLTVEKEGFGENDDVAFGARVS